MRAWTCSAISDRGMRMSVRRRQILVLKSICWLLALTPVLVLGVQLQQGMLGANPVEVLIRSTGDWALRGLCVVLALTPLQVVAGWSLLAAVRRLIGLAVFGYALLHAVLYGWLEMGWSWGALRDDLAQRWFVLAGAAALLVLLVLALTSPHAVIRWLGGRRWKRLHQWVHAAAWLVLLHFFWMRSGKNDVLEVFWYAAIVLALQLWRVIRQVRSLGRNAPLVTAASGRQAARR